MIKDGINNSTNYQPWISYVTSENLVFNQFVDILFFFSLLSLFVWLLLVIFSFLLMEFAVLLFKC